MVDFRQDTVDADFSHPQDSKVMKTEVIDSEEDHARSSGTSEKSWDHSREKRERSIPRRRRGSLEKRRLRATHRRPENHSHTRVDDRRRNARIRRRSPRLRSSLRIRSAGRRPLSSPKTLQKLRPSTPPRRIRRALSASRKPRIRRLPDRPNGVALQSRPKSLRRGWKRGASPMRIRRREPARISTPVKNRRRGEVLSSRIPTARERRGRRLRSPRRSQEKRPMWRGSNRRNDMQPSPRRSGIPRGKDSIRNRRGDVPRISDSRREGRGTAFRARQHMRELQKDTRPVRDHSLVRRSDERESSLPQEEQESSFQTVNSSKPDYKGYMVPKPLELGPPSPRSTEEPILGTRQKEGRGLEDIDPQEYQVRFPRVRYPWGFNTPPCISTQPEWPLFVHVEDEKENKRHSNFEPSRTQKRKRLDGPKKTDWSSKRKKTTHQSDRSDLEEDKYRRESCQPKIAITTAYGEEYKYEIDKRECQNYYRSHQEEMANEQSILHSIPAMRKPPKPALSWPAIRRPPADVDTHVSKPSLPIFKPTASEHNNVQQWSNDSTFNTLNGYRRTVSNGRGESEHIRTVSSNEKSRDPSYERTDQWSGYRSNNVLRNRLSHRTVGKPEFSKTGTDYSDSESVNFSESETIKVIVQCREQSPPRIAKQFPKQEPLLPSKTEPIIIRPKVTGLSRGLGPRVIRPKVTDSTVTSYFSSNGGRQGQSPGKCSIDIDRSLADIFSTFKKTISVREVKKKVVEPESRDRRPTARVLNPQKGGKVARMGYSVREGISRREGQQLKRGGLISRTRQRRVNAQRRGRRSGSRRGRRRR